MPSRYVFPSIGGRQVAYTLHTDSSALWDQCYHTARALGLRYGEYRTYGDGLTQHEGERAVVLDNAPDYLASLAKFVLEHKPENEDELRNLLWCWPDDPSRERIVFALSVKAKPGKRLFFNPQDRKISGRETLEHDKRWHAVKESHDGSIDSAMAVLNAREDRCIEYALEVWIKRDAVRRVYLETEGAWAPAIAEEYFGRDSRGIPEAAFDAAAQAFASLRARWSAGRRMESYERYLASKAEKEQQAKSEGAA